MNHRGAYTASDAQEGVEEVEVGPAAGEALARGVVPRRIEREDVVPRLCGAPLDHVVRHERPAVAVLAHGADRGTRQRVDVDARPRCAPLVDADPRGVVAVSFEDDRGRHLPRRRHRVGGDVAPLTRPAPHAVLLACVVAPRVVRAGVDAREDGDARAPVGVVVREVDAAAPRRVFGFRVNEMRRRLDRRKELRRAPRQRTARGEDGAAPQHDQGAA
mmetsp:Transcript_7648/g.31638  ORF Transcript_7648/g.31638 Transcript_7648/m.31638 type:complete len:217 (-) Transcript_7648:26-676(-)